MPELTFYQKEWSDDDLKLITGFIVHAADLCGPSMDFDLAFYWSQRINQEFTDQVTNDIFWWCSFAN